MGTNGDDDITVIARDSSYNVGCDGVQDFTVSVNQGPDILLINAPTLYLDGLSGDDDFDIRAPAPNGAAWNVQVFVAGGPPAASDKLVFETPGSNTVIYTPTGADSGTLLLDQGGSNSLITMAPFTIPALNYTSSPGGIEQVIYDGQSGVDNLTVRGTASDDTFTHTPGANGNAGAFQINDLLGLSYQNIAAGSVLTVNGLGGTNTLVANGTTANDLFQVDATGTVKLNNRQPIAVTTIPPITIQNLRLVGLAGDDTFQLQATLPYANITLEGDEPSASDVLNMTGTVGVENITVNLGTATITGFGSTVTYSGIEQVTLDGGGGGGADTLTLNGTAGSDTISYTPADVQAGQFQNAGLNTLFNFSRIGGTFSIDPLGGSNTVTVNGTAGNNVITAIGDATTPTVQVDGLKTASLVLADVSALAINGGAGNDKLTVDSSTAPFAIPITYDGGSGSNSLMLQGGTATGGDTYTPGPGVGAGMSKLVFAGGTESVNFLNLAPVLDLVGGTLVVNGTNADNAINYSVGSLATNGLVSVDGQETIEFSNKTTLTINALAGSDEININNANTPSGLTGITVNGGDPTGSDTLIVNGVGTTVTVATAIDQITGATGTGGAIPISLTTGTIEHVIVNRGASTTLAVTGSSTYIYTPAVNVAGGTIESDARFPIDFTGFDSTTTLSFTGTGATSPLVVNGTPGNDVFNVAAGTGNVTIADPNGNLTRATIASTAIGRLTLNGLDGDDTFNIPGNHPFNSLLVSGGDPSASDVLNFTGNGAGAVSVDLAAQTVTETGFNPVSFAGVEVLNVAANNALTINGTPGPDGINYTPTGTSAGTVTRDGSNLAINFTVVTGTFTIDPLAGIDTIRVNGTSGGDAITATGGATATVQVTAPVLGALKTVSIPTANIESLVIAAGNGADALTVDSSTAPFLIPLVYDGGIGIDSLTLTGGTASSDIYSVGPQAGAGTSTIVFTSGGGGTQLVNFINVEPMLDLVNMVVGSLTINATNADNAINYGFGSSDGVTTGVVSVERARDDRVR